LPETQAPPISDAARRIADSMNLHAIAKSRGWAVFALADGTTNNVPYETYDDALRSKNWDRDRFLYLQIQAGGMPDIIAQRYLEYARMLQDHGARLPDPRDYGAGDRYFPYHEPPVMRRDWARQIANLAKR
jgi:hypothetical protein